VSKIEIGRFSELLRRMLGQKGQETVAAELSPEVSPVIVIEGMGAEWDFLKSVRGCSLVALTGPAVGATSVFRLRNPADSGVLGVVKFMAGNASVNILQTLAIGTALADLAVAVNTVTVDRRWNATGTTQSLLLASTNNAADAVGPVGNNIGVFAPLADTEWVYTREIVLVPGTHIDWGITGTNIGIRTYASWIERQFPLLEQ